MEFNEYKIIFNRYITLTNPPLKNKCALKTLIETDPTAVEILITHVDNYAFRNLMDEFNLPEEYATIRENLEREVIQNYQQSGYSAVKEAIADILFHNISNNAGLLIESVKERAQYDKAFNKKYAPYAELFDAMTELLSFNKAEISTEQLGAQINKLRTLANKAYANGIKPHEALKALFEEAQTKFNNEIATQIKSFNTVIANIEPEYITIQDGSMIPIYKIKNQTENQKNFTFLVKTYDTHIDDDELYHDGALEAYCKQMENRPYSSYGLISQCLMGVFAASRLKFGFTSLGEGQLLSSNIMDGQTNQYTIKKGKYVRLQQVMPLKQFIKQTYGYNELVYDKPHTIKPEFIISFTEIPNERDIKVAKAMHLPIVFIDRSCYKLINNKKIQLPYFEYGGFMETPLPTKPSLKHKI